MDAGQPDQGLTPAPLDYCTLWPDVWFGQNIGPCCLVHDIAYTRTLTLVQKFNADKELAQCVMDKTHSPVLAFVMLCGVLVFGLTFWARAKRSTNSTPSKR